MRMIVFNCQMQNLGKGWSLVAPVDIQKVLDSISDNLPLKVIRWEGMQMTLAQGVGDQEVAV